MSALGPVASASVGMGWWVRRRSVEQGPHLCAKGPLLQRQEAVPVTPAQWRRAACARGRPIPYTPYTLPYAFWPSTMGAADMDGWAAAVAVRRAAGAPPHEQPLTPNVMQQAMALLGLGMQTRRRRFCARPRVAAGLHTGVSSGRWEGRPCRRLPLPGPDFAGLLCR